MAVRILFLSCVLVAACKIATAQTAEAQLVKAMSDPAVKSFTLTKHVVLTAALPNIIGKNFTLIGALNGGKGKVRIDGNGKIDMLLYIYGPEDPFDIRTSPPFIITVENLVLARSTFAAITFSAYPNACMGCKLIVTDVDFVKNSMAVYNDRAASVYTRSTFTGQTATAVTNNRNTLAEGLRVPITFNRCTFTNNTGAVTVPPSYQLSISNSNFISNRGYRCIVAPAGGLSVTVVSSNFTGNSAGAIFVSGPFGRLSISNSIFKNNVALRYPGGALYIKDGAKAVVSKSVFIGNSAPPSFGGAFWVSTKPPLQTKVNFCKCTFKGNTGLHGVASNGYITNTTRPGYPSPRTLFSKDVGVTIPAVQRDNDAPLKLVTITSACPV